MNYLELVKRVWTFRVVKGTKNDPFTDVKTVRNERHFGSFERKIKLPEDAGVENIEANLGLGVLTITVPRRGGEDKKTHVKVN